MDIVGGVRTALALGTCALALAGCGGSRSKPDTRPAGRPAGPAQPTATATLSRPISPRKK